MGAFAHLAPFVRHHNTMIDAPMAGRVGVFGATGRAQAAARISSPMAVSWSVPTSTAAM